MYAKWTNKNSIPNFRAFILAPTSLAPLKKMANRKSKQTLLTQSSENTGDETLAVPSDQAPQSNPVLEAAVDRILSTLDCDGLAKELTTKLANELLSKVSVTDLVTSFFSENADELTVLMKKRLMERLLAS